MKSKPERISVFKLTQECWYPSYRLDGYYKGDQNVRFLEVTFLQFPPIGKSVSNGWRVCVWGGDDFGMEKDFPLDQREEAFQLFTKVIQQEYVSKSFLMNQEFGAS